MKILHVFDHSIPLQSGYTFRSRAIISEQRKLGWKTCQVTSAKHNSGHDTPEVEDIDGLRFYRSKPVDGLWKALPVLNQWQIIRTLEQRILEAADVEHPDIIHAHSPALNGVAALRAGKKLGLPIVYEVRGFWEDAAVSHGTSRENGLRYRLTRGMETWVLKNVDAVTCICEGIRGGLISRGINPSRITVIPNAVDTTRFQPVDQRDIVLQESLNLSGKKVIAFIGSFYSYEGLDMLVSAMPKLLDIIPNVRLLLVGGGQVENELKSQISGLGLDDKVIMTGRVPYNEIERYYSIADILAYPRKSMRLTELVTPLKPLEAMAQKCLFVASDVGGHRELIEDGVTGVLFKADDVNDLTRKLTGLLEDEQSWPAITNAGRHYVEFERNWKNSIANLKEVYGNLTTQGMNIC